LKKKVISAYETSGTTYVVTQRHIPGNIFLIKPLCKHQNSLTYKLSADCSRGELRYLAPLGSENISAPYFKQCFFREGGITPQTVKHHASQSQDRNNKYFISYIEFCINNKI